MKIVFDTREYLEEAWHLIERIPLAADARNQYVGAMLFSAFNICDGMQLLIQKGNFVSSNILVRSLFEYVFRAFWLSRVATNEQAVSSMKLDSWPKTLKLHEDIKEKSGIIDLLCSERMKISKILHSYTHGGNQNPLSQMGNDGYITPNIPDQEVIYFLRVLQLSAFFVLSELIYLSGSKEFDGALTKIGEKLVEDVSI